MRDCETTITIDMQKFPTEYRTGDKNPFERLDRDQLGDVENWVHSLIPGHDKTYCAEVIGKMPYTVALLIGGILEDTGCQRLTCVNPGHSVQVVWDYMGREN
jgi:hypothetical protein